MMQIPDNAKARETNKKIFIIKHPFKVGLLPSRKVGFICLNERWKPFKNDEKFFLFHLKSSFRSDDS